MEQSLGMNPIIQAAENIWGFGQLGFIRPLVCVLSFADRVVGVDLPNSCVYCFDCHAVVRNPIGYLCFPASRPLVILS
jgi:hypothetical protein